MHYPKRNATAGQTQRYIGNKCALPAQHNAVVQAVWTRRNVQYRIIFPDQLRVTHGGHTYMFENPSEAECCVERLDMGIQLQM